MKSVVVTSYNNPDTDGVACAVAYCELSQNAHNHRPIYYFFGEINGETKSLISFLNITLQPTETFPPKSKVVLVDTHHVRQVPEMVDLENVVEIIDHHPNGDPDSFPNAIISNEPVGAAATIIAERFFKLNISPLVSTAGLLLGAILSNSLGFQSSSTSARDHKMAEWLMTFGYNANEVSNVMQDGRRVAFFENLVEQLFSDLKRFEFEGEEILVGQIEMAYMFRDVSFETIRNAFNERLRSDQPVHIMNCVDISVGKSMVLFATKELFERVGHEIKHSKSEKLVIYSDHVLQRKTDILPHLTK